MKKIDRVYALPLLLMALVLVCAKFFGASVGESTGEATSESTAPQIQTRNEDVTPRDTTSGAKIDATNESTEQRSRLETLKECWSNNDCPFFSNEDPRANHFEASLKIKDELTSLVALKKEQPARDFSRVAREFVRFPDDAVREAAIELFSGHETSEANLQALLEGLSKSHSAPLFESAMGELARYQAAGFDSQIVAFLEKILETGSPAVAEMIARKLLPLLSDANDDRFRAVARKLPAGSRCRYAIEAALEEHQRLVAGG